jgi:hypothetical protein
LIQLDAIQSHIYFHIRLQHCFYNNYNHFIDYYILTYNAKKNISLCSWILNENKVYIFIVKVFNNFLRVIIPFFFFECIQNSEIWLFFLYKKKLVFHIKYFIQKTTFSIKIIFFLISSFKVIISCFFNISFNFHYLSCYEFWEVFDDE